MTDHQQLANEGIKILHETPRVAGWIIFGLEDYTPGVEIQLNSCLGFMGELHPVHIAGILERKARQLRADHARGLPGHESLAEARANPRTVAE